MERCAVADQLWVMRPRESRPPDPAFFNTPELVPEFARNKPRGGYFWTSTLDAAGSSWLRWCMSESYGDPREEPGFRFFSMRPRADARIFVIDSLADYRRLYEEHPFDGPSVMEDRRGVDWNAALRAYDGIRLTQGGEGRLRYDAAELHDLYGWDCESTVWGAWVFEEIREIDGAPLIAAAAEQLAYA